MDRAGLSRGDNFRVQPEPLELLPGQPGHPRSDGGLPGENVPSALAVEKKSRADPIINISPWLWLFYEEHGADPMEADIFRRLISDGGVDTETRQYLAAHHFISGRPSFRPIATDGSQ